ncbi:hypothetical protein CSAL01_11544 [Colletotrichum salicis]|uniref:Uncharacterized protein n=1 Tax=Colletotrichum salicis TaxID=1209931 RepID=A0A135T9Z1_9PEZI|nr:hypothetical protein CSAL01_11544 [Colletotrichum salicis]
MKVVEVVVLGIEAKRINKTLRIEKKQSPNSLGDEEGEKSKRCEKGVTERIEGGGGGKEEDEEGDRGKGSRVSVPYGRKRMRSTYPYGEEKEEEEEEKKGGRRRATALLRTMNGPEAELDQNRLQTRPNQRRRGRACKSVAAAATNARHAASRKSQEQELARWLCVLGIRTLEEGSEPHEKRQYQQQQQSTGIDGVCRSMEGLINV